MDHEHQFYGVFALFSAAIFLFSWFDDWSSGIADNGETGFVDQSNEEEYQRILNFKLCAGLGSLLFGLISIFGFLS
jgi:hypothetical protein